MKRRRRRRFRGAGARIVIVGNGIPFAVWPAWRYQRMRSVFVMALAFLLGPALATQAAAAVQINVSAPPPLADTVTVTATVTGVQRLAQVRMTVDNVSIGSCAAT